MRKNHSNLDQFKDSTRSVRGPNGIHRKITFTQGKKNKSSLALVDDELARLSGFIDRTAMLTRLGHTDCLDQDVYFNPVELRFYILKDLTPNSPD